MRENGGREGEGEGEGEGEEEGEKKEGYCIHVQLKCPDQMECVLHVSCHYCMYYVESKIEHL